MTRFSNCTIAARDYWHAHIFATKCTIKVSKIPPESSGNKLSGYVSISILIKCGEWMVYAETVTYMHARPYRSPREAYVTGFAKRDQIPQKSKNELAIPRFRT